MLRLPERAFAAPDLFFRKFPPGIFRNFPVFSVFPGFFGFSRYFPEILRNFYAIFPESGFPFPDFPNPTPCKAESFQKSAFRGNPQKKNFICFFRFFRFPFPAIPKNPAKGR